MTKFLAALLFVVLAVPTQAATGPGSPGWKTPQIGSRLFYVVAHSEKTIDGTSYRRHTAFDIAKRDGDSVTIITGRGELLTLDPTDHDDMQFSRVPWDTANNIPTARDVPEKRFTRYYHFMTSMLTRWWFFILVLSLSAGVSFAVCAADDERLGQVAFCVIAMLLVFGFGTYMGNGYLRYMETYDAAVTLLAPYRLHEVYLLPVQYSFIDPERTAQKAAGLLYLLCRLLWVPMFLLLHLCFLVCLPRVIRGLHYLFVPHPVEKHLVNALAGKPLQKEAIVASMRRGSRTSPPPTWVSKNKKQRLDALRGQVEAKEKLLDTFIRWRRKKAEIEDP